MNISSGLGCGCCGNCCDKIMIKRPVDKTYDSNGNLISVSDTPWIENGQVDWWTPLPLSGGNAINSLDGNDGMLEFNVTVPCTNYRLDVEVLSSSNDIDPKSSPVKRGLKIKVGTGMQVDYRLPTIDTAAEGLTNLGSYDSMQWPTITSGAFSNHVKANKLSSLPHPQAYSQTHMTYSFYEVDIEGCAMAFITGEQVGVASTAATVHNKTREWEGKGDPFFSAGRRVNIQITPDSAGTDVEIGEVTMYYGGNQCFDVGSIPLERPANIDAATNCSLGSLPSVFDIPTAACINDIPTSTFNTTAMPRVGTTQVTGCTAPDTCVDDPIIVESEVDYSAMVGSHVWTKYVDYKFPYKQYNAVIGGGAYSKSCLFDMEVANEATADELIEMDDFMYRVKRLQMTDREITFLYDTTVWAYGEPEHEVLIELIDDAVCAITYQDDTGLFTDTDPYGKARLTLPAHVGVSDLTAFNWASPIVDDPCYIPEIFTSSFEAGQWFKDWNFQPSDWATGSVTCQQGLVGTVGDPFRICKGFVELIAPCTAPGTDYTTEFDAVGFFPDLLTRTESLSGTGPDWDLDIEYDSYKYQAFTVWDGDNHVNSAINWTAGHSGQSASSYDIDTRLTSGGMHMKLGNLVIRDGSTLRLSDGTDTTEIVVTSDYNTMLPYAPTSDVAWDDDFFFDYGFKNGYNLWEIATYDSGTGLGSTVNQLYVGFKTSMDLSTDPRLWIFLKDDVTKFAEIDFTVIANKFKQRDVPTSVFVDGESRHSIGVSATIDMGYDEGNSLALVRIYQ